MTAQADVLTAEAEAAHRRHEAATDCAAFIHRYVRIEDPDTPGSVVPFHLWKAQRHVLKVMQEERLLIVLKARQLGLTWLALAYALWRMLFNPGYTVVVLSKGEDEAKECIRRLRTMLQHLPKWMVREDTPEADAFNGPRWDAKVESMTIRFPGSPVESRMLAEAASPGSGRSFTASLVLIDEWAFQQHAGEIWAAAYPTVNRPTGGQVIGVSTMEVGTLFQEIWQAATKQLNGFRAIFLPWTAHPARDKAWYDATARAIPHTVKREYPATPEEAQSVGQHLAFPGFVPDRGGPNVCAPFAIPDWWRRWRSNDPGHGDAFAWHWYAAAPDGRIFIYREFAREPDGQRLDYSEQARIVWQLSVLGSEIGEPVLDDGKRVQPERIEFTAAGWDAARDLGEKGASIAEWYRQGGVVDIVEAPRDPDGRYAAVSEGLRIRQWPDNPLSAQLGRNGRQTSTVVIFSTCKLLIQALPKLNMDERNANRVASNPHTWTHYFDSLGYGLQTWHAQRSVPPPEELSPIQRHKRELVSGRRGPRGPMSRLL